MAELKLYFADCAGAPSNCSYPHESVGTDAIILRQVCLLYTSRSHANIADRTFYGHGLQYGGRWLFGTVRIGELIAGQGTVTRASVGFQPVDDYILNLFI